MRSFNMEFWQSQTQGKRAARDVAVRLSFTMLLGAATLLSSAVVGFAQAVSPEPLGVPIAPTVAIGILPRDLSPWGMFLNADIVVKAVMVGLVFTSVVTWTVWLAKSYELWTAKKKARIALGILARARSLRRCMSNLPIRTIRWGGWCR